MKIILLEIFIFVNMWNIVFFVIIKSKGAKRMDDELPKEEYIEAINNALNKCMDIELIDFIFQILKKSICNATC